LSTALGLQTVDRSCVGRKGDPPTREQLASKVTDPNDELRRQRRVPQINAVLDALPMVAEGLGVLM
jgi:hypothetical protein